MHFAPLRENRKFNSPAHGKKMGGGKSKAQKEDSADYAVERSQLIARVIPPTDLVKLICSYLRYDGKWNVDDEKGFRPWLDSINWGPRVPWRGAISKEVRTFFIYTDGGTSKTEPTIVLDGVTLSSGIIRDAYATTIFPSCGYLHLSARHYDKLDAVCKWLLAHRLYPVIRGQTDSLLLLQFDDVRCPLPDLASDPDSRLTVDLTLAFCKLPSSSLLFCPVACRKSC